MAIVVLICLNFYTLAAAYLTMTHPLNLGGAELPRGLSVYYIALIATNAKQKLNELRQRLRPNPKF